jgi:hypothetical protein
MVFVNARVTVFVRLMMMMMMMMMTNLTEM